MTFLKKLFSRKKRPSETICVSYAEAEQYLQKGWVLSPKEDSNRVVGMVYLERQA